MSKRPASSADDKQPKRAKKDETDTTATLGQSAVRALAAELQAGVSHVERCLGLLASGHTVPFIARYRAHETGGMEPPLLRRIEAAAKEAANLAARCDAIVATLRKADRLTAELERELRAAPTLSALEAVYAPHKAKPCSLAERCCGPVHRTHGSPAGTGSGCSSAQCDGSKRQSWQRTPLERYLDVWVGR